MAKVLVFPSGAKIQLFSELFCGRGANALKKILYEMHVPFILHSAYSDFIVFFHLIIFCSGFFQCTLCSLSRSLRAAGERFDNSFKINIV